MNELTEGDKKLLSDIKEVGWHVIQVLEDEKGPGFSYSIGLYKTFKHPEIVIIGLKRELSHILINNIAEDIKNGFSFKSGHYYPDILDNFNCLMIQVKEEYFKEYFGYGLWFYKKIKFPVLQCIYPTIRGIYPWEQDWPYEIQDLQPILGHIEEINKK